MICFLGDSHAPKMLRRGAEYHRIPVTEDASEADVIFVSQDTPTHEDGTRSLETIRKLVGSAVRRTRAEKTIVLTSQVPIGFTRSLGVPIYHQAETLRIKDAFIRAIYPEQHIVGCEDPAAFLPETYLEYLEAFKCPIHKMTYEEAEFSKIAINLTLISQVENTNRLSEYAEARGISWDVIQKVLANDKRIGPYSYLEPGRWQNSPHLLRDYVSFNESS